ncbi:hypothetical protein VOLCADRAFT_115790 [Volvox carteri f. nagariensis]|uniref:ShKT domain-containing protein n=1 Tax=Volvox carteri f. nagariensis TaxID=3068 RepID=D8TI99_VOLCA|nr:uncharacterized protein VOLCADRAFT_115790 [Volvox carteri f. nagariensis]EFJ52852.1 hypothetical protein VOLCADRAFT_115790 [Volvox carteri f. nagariensis]|eukprot:XP_002945857.1 hypothetical protein VOLCADRAFT_115790 [Volvox carteri f. nagariensis]
MTLIAVVNLFYIWPVKLGSSPARTATSSLVPHIRLHARKELAELKTALSDGLPSPFVRLHCADQIADCEQLRRNGRCSTHLLDGFHTCLSSCGVCPALELALRKSMNLTVRQLVVVRQAGPPRCADEASWCDQLAETAITEGEAEAGGKSGGGPAAAGAAAAAAAAAAECASGPMQLVGVCKQCG